MGNNSTRVMQSVDDREFEIEVKFDSIPDQKYQQQGILVEQDSGNWLRFDLHHNGSSLRAYAARVVNDVVTTVKNTSAQAGAESYPTS